MIAKLKGILEEKSKERVILDVQGVGYGLLVPELVAQRLPECGELVTFFVYTHVREDQISLFGFAAALEKDVFEILLSASGIGPKLALAVLSALEARQILEGLVSGNKALFAGISGVGKKTVEKIFLEVREKAEKRWLLEKGEAPDGRKGKISPISRSAHWSGDLEQALLALGYREADVKLMVRETLQRGAHIDTFDTALKLALQVFSAGSKHKAVKGTA